MKKELRILLSLAAIVAAGVAIASVVYNRGAHSTPSAVSGTQGTNPGGVTKSYGVSLREELLRPDSHSMGPENAPLIVVEFLDPECESCKAFYPHMKHFLKEKEGKVRFVVRYMAFHTSSAMAIGAAESAGLQGKYWEMLELLFENAEEWGHKPEPQAAFFEKYAQNLGLDVARFKADLVDPRWKVLIERDMADGKVLGVRGTPTVYLNGDILQHLSIDGLRAQTDPILKTVSP